MRPRWSHADCRTQGGKPHVPAGPVKRRRPSMTGEQVRAMVKAGLSGDCGRQQRGLIVAPLEQSRPMQRNRGHQHIPQQDGLCRPRHPDPHWFRDVQPIAMFQGQHQFSRRVTIEKSGTPTRPGPGNGHAVVTMHNLGRVRLAGQGRPAEIADQTRDEGRIPPACCTKAEVCFDKAAAAQAARRIDKVQSRLKLCCHPPICRP